MFCVSKGSDVIHIKAVENDRKGITKLYRNRKEVEDRWKVMGGRPSKGDWFRKGGITGVLNVPYSKNNRVKHSVENILRTIPGPTDQKIRVQERPGPSLRVSVVSNDPFPKDKCERVGCPLGRDGKCKNRCFKENIGYTITCRRCLDSGQPPRIYVGETNRSIYTRFNGHLSDLKTSIKNDRGNSWMFNHLKEAHNGEYNERDLGADWRATLTGNFRKPLDRQVSEFIGIRRARVLGQGRVGTKDIEVDKTVFNTKDEWFSHSSQWDVVG